MSGRPVPPRFALLWHECPDDYRDGPHWDLMLERVGLAEEHRLATWSLLELPSAWTLNHAPTTAAPVVAATGLPDHRAHYLDYEGAVSGGLGSVKRIAGGPLEWLEAGDSLVVVRLFGESPFVGGVELRRVSGDAWTLGIR